MSQTQRYVIFTGPSQSGKTLAAQLLVTAFRTKGLLAMHHSFTYPMKHYLGTLLGRKVSGIRLEESISELLWKTPRDFLRLEAAHLRFNYGPNVVGRLLQARAKQMAIDPKYIVVDDGTSILDCRTLGDYRLIQITRDNIDRVYPFMMPNAHMTIRNNGTVAQLEAKVRLIADKLEDEE